MHCKYNVILIFFVRTILRHGFVLSKNLLIHVVFLKQKQKTTRPCRGACRVSRNCFADITQVKSHTLLMVQKYLVNNGISTTKLNWCFRRISGCHQQELHQFCIFQVPLSLLFPQILISWCTWPPWLDFFFDNFWASTQDETQLGTVLQPHLRSVGCG